MDILARLDRVADRLILAGSYNDASSVDAAIEEIKELRALVRRYLIEKDSENSEENVDPLDNPAEM